MFRLLSLLFVMWFGLGNAVAQPLTLLSEVDPPAQYLNAAGQPAGYSVELVQELQRRVSNGERIQFVPWARAYRQALTEAHVVLFPTARTAAREALFHWIGPIMDIDLGLYAKADSKIQLNNLEEAKAVGRIGVYRDDVGDQILSSAGFTNLDRGINKTKNVKKLMRGFIDLNVASSLTYALIAKQAGYHASNLRHVLSFHKVELFLAMSLGTPPGVVAEWRNALESMHKDGTVERLKMKHFPAAFPAKARNRP
jgi:ABC-type amino acid transport substrate-binding protein